MNYLHTCDAPILNSTIGDEYCSKCGEILGSADELKVLKDIKGPVRLGKCQACKKKLMLERHHIIPKRTGLKTKYLFLCTSCHEIADYLADTYYVKEVEYG